MSERLDQFRHHVRGKLRYLGDHVRDLGARVETVATKASVDEEIREAEAALRRVKDDAVAAKARMNTQLLERKGEDREAIVEWKRNRNVSRLELRAEQAETYAAWSVIVATAAIDEASLATMRAIAARLDVEGPPKASR